MKKLLLLSLLLASNCAAQTFTPIRVRCGANQSPFTDSHGNVWGSDAGLFAPATGTTFTSGPVSGTDAALFTSQRNGIMTYTFAVPNGTYSLSLLFSELWPGAAKAGVREFNVAVNGAALLTNFDIFAKAGFATPDTETFPITVTNGQIQIAFTVVLNHPAIDAIEIVSATAAVPPKFQVTTFNGQLVDCATCDGTDNISIATSMFSGATLQLTQDGQILCTGKINASTQFTCSVSVNVLPAMINVVASLTIAGASAPLGSVTDSIPEILIDGASVVTVIIGLDSMTQKPRLFLVTEK